MSDKPRSEKVELARNILSTRGLEVTYKDVKPQLDAAGISEGYWNVMKSNFRKEQEAAANGVAVVHKNGKPAANKEAKEAKATKKNQEAAAKAKEQAEQEAKSIAFVKANGGYQAASQRLQAESQRLQEESKLLKLFEALFVTGVGVA
jgi:hypothetical protein